MEESLIFIFGSELEFDVCLILNIRNFGAWSLGLERVCICEEFGLRGYEVRVAVNGKEKAC